MKNELTLNLFSNYFSQRHEGHRVILRNLPLCAPCTPCRVRNWGIIFTIIPLLIYAGCSNVISPPPKQSGNVGTFSLETDRLHIGRTIIPKTVKEDFAIYTLVFSSSGKTDVTVDRTNATLGSPVSLSVGTWSLTVTAYMDSAKTKPCAWGSLENIVINAGANTSRSLELKANIEAGAQGTFSWNITFPPEVTVAGVTITPENPVTGTPEQTLYFTSGIPLADKDNSASPLSLNTGIYNVYFFMQEGGRDTGWEGWLHIYENMESKFEYDFTGDSGPSVIQLSLQLTEENWLGLLAAIAEAGRDVELDLSACTRSNSSTGGGLRSDGTFDPLFNVSTGKGRIVSITLPDAATSITASIDVDTYTSTFRHFNSLKTVNGINVTSIGKRAFQFDTTLTSVSFPAVTSIDDSFIACTALTSASFPAATSIVNDAFLSCTALTSVGFSAAATFSDNPFVNCPSLTSFDLTGSGPLSAVEGGRALVRNGTELLAYPSASGLIEMNTITSIGNYAFRLCADLTSASFPAATSIGSYAFMDCTALTSASFPAVTNFGIWAFSRCTALTSVIFSAAATFSNNPFSNCPLLISFNLSGTGPLSTLENGKALVRNSTELLAYPSACSIEMNTITSIGTSAFVACEALISASFPAVTNIDEYAFQNCTALVSASFPAATSIGRNAFYGAGTTPLTITLGMNAPSVGINILSFSLTGLSRTVTVKVPSGATGYGSIPAMYYGTDSTNNWGNAFRGKGWNGTNYLTGTVNSNVTLNVVYDSTLDLSPTLIQPSLQLTEENWLGLLAEIAGAGNYVELDLSACTRSGSSTGGGLRSDGTFAPLFTVSEGKGRIVSITLPDAATSIASGYQQSGNYAFQQFSNLKTVNGANVTSIGSDAFSYCTTLTNVSFPVATSVGSGAFSRCAALTSASFPAATSIGSYAFMDCTALTNASFPVATSFGIWAFSRCTALTNVSFSAAATFSNNPFSNCPLLISFNLIGNGHLSILENGKALVRNGTELVAYPSASGSIEMNSITSIGSYAFMYDNALTSASFPAVTSIGEYAFYGTGATPLTITLGMNAPSVWTNIFYWVINPSKTVTVKVPAGATGYGPIPATYSGTNSTNNWGNAFRGIGWDGTSYLSGTVNNNITLRIEYQ